MNSGAGFGRIDKTAIKIRPSYSREIKIPQKINVWSTCSEIKSATVFMYSSYD